MLAHMTFPAQHRAKLRSTDPIERLNEEIKRRTDVLGIFLSEISIRRLIGPTANPGDPARSHMIFITLIPRLGRPSAPAHQKKTYAPRGQFLRPPRTTRQSSRRRPQ